MKVKERKIIKELKTVNSVGISVKKNSAVLLLNIIQVITNVIFTEMKSLMEVMVKQMVLYAMLRLSTMPTPNIQSYH